MCSRRVKQFLFSNKEPSVSLIVKRGNILVGDGAKK
jgi:hypothetical protein